SSRRRHTRSKRDWSSDVCSSDLLRSLGRFPLQAAFRYHKQPNERPTLALVWTRFPDSSVIAAVVERAIATTLVTNEGRSLTEVKLTVKNQAQPFLKVALPQGASILSVEVAGEKAKPVEGSDGNRVPLLRAGFRPRDAYEVSFVFMHSGAPFAKKVGSEISLPKMDVPIDLLQWEVFLPEQYRRSEEHTSELQSRFDLVCRLLLEKKKKNLSQN